MTHSDTAEAGKKERAKKRQWIEDAFQSLMSDLGLLPCNIVFRDEDEQAGAVFDKVIGIHYNYPYPQVDVVLFPIVYTMDHEELKRSVLHEVMHLVLWELKHFRNESEKVWEDLEEKTVERLAMYFSPLLP